MWILFSDEDKQAFEAWHAHDDAEDNFCELDGESSIIIWDSRLFLSLVLDINSLHCLPSSSFNELKHSSALTDKGLMFENLSGLKLSMVVNLHYQLSW